MSGGTGKRLAESLRGADVTGIVLAGGRARRYGADKLAEPIAHGTLLGRAIDAVSVVAAEIVVVGAPRALPESPGVPIRLVSDPEPFGGPLQALAGALAATGTPLAIVVAGDMPSLVPEVLALLVHTLIATADADAAILVDPGDPLRRQPVPLAIRTGSALAVARASLDAGDRSLVRLLGRLRVVEIAAETWLRLDPEAQTLVDIDLPDDLRRARAVARDQRMR